MHYPIAVDNGYKTWDAYQNEYWPAEYLIDATGQVRHAEFGEGDYGGDRVAHPHAPRRRQPEGQAPAAAPTSPTRRPTRPLTPESYLGYQYGLPELRRHEHHREPARRVQVPEHASPRRPGLRRDLDRGRGEDHRRAPDARLELAFQADHVYLVLGGTGTVKVTVGSHTQTIDVSGIPRLYTLVSSPTFESATLVLDFSPGVDAYDFTFG